MLRIEKNEQHNGIELYFDGKPSEETRSTLKAHGYRWHSLKKCWYAKDTEARQKVAEAIANGQEVEAPKKKETKKETANIYGVKVGDIFTATWGWEQTNVDFFQVIELIGKKSVRVRQVRPEVTDTNYHCQLSWDNTYKLTTEILPPAPFSVFIEDQEHGDIKRVVDAGWKDRPAIKFANYCYAYKEIDEVVTHYESHYA